MQKWLIKNKLKVEKPTANNIFNGQTLTLCIIDKNWKFFFQDVPKGKDTYFPILATSI
jgi:hypothetical protein